MHVCLFVKRAFAYDVIISTYGFVYGQTMGKNIGRDICARARATLHFDNETSK